ncbi:MAG: M23 family metallopeptidase [Oscillospiraceae bacterium]|nr:M23 family metallopeptidase [Oscillospiraceae bacterium]
MKTTKKKEKNSRLAIIATIIIIVLFSVYAFYFPATMGLLDENLNKLCKTAGLDLTINIFSDYSVFLKEAVSYAAEAAEKINYSLEEKNLSFVVTSCAAKFPSESVNITSAFGKRADPISGRADNHSGIDIAAAEGSNVFAAWPGRIIETGFDKIYGKYIILEHSKDFLTKYCHLSKISVFEKTFINAGEKIGETGKTGRTTGSHLHFEVIIEGRNIDPMECFEI